MIPGLSRRPIAPNGCQFRLVRGFTKRARDGWFEVSWNPNWTGSRGDAARLFRRRIRGKWIRIQVTNGTGTPIFRRLSFFSAPTAEPTDARGAVAVRLSWDDRIALLGDTDLTRRESDVQLNLSCPRPWDWPRILVQIPQENGEGALVGICGVALAVIGLLVGIAPISIGVATCLGAEPTSAQSAATDRAETNSVSKHITSPTASGLGRQKWNLIGGDQCELVLRSTGAETGSRGLSIEQDASGDQQLVLSVETSIQSGSWTLRVDDGQQAPNYLPLASYPACRVAGSRHYRFLIYSDDPKSAVAIKEATVRLATDKDDDIPLVWPTSGPIVQAEMARGLDQWRALFRVAGDEPDVEQATRVAEWIHGRSRVVSTAATRHASFGSPSGWQQSRSIDGDCGVFAKAMVDLLARCGLIGRIVSLGSARFENGEELGDTHALVEVFDRKHGRWVLVDPTFNIVFEDSGGRLLGIADLMDLRRRGGDWKPKEISPPIPGRAVDTYYLPFASLLWVADAPAVPDLGDSGLAFRAREHTVAEIMKSKYPDR